MSNSAAFCVYCQKEKPLGDFNKEHVIPEAFGGFKGALTLAEPSYFRVCTACNQRMGDTLDLALSRGSYEAVLRFSHGVASSATLGGLKRSGPRISLPRSHPLAPLILQFVPSRVDGRLSVAPASQIRLTLRDGSRRCLAEEDIERQLPDLLPVAEKAGVGIFYWAGDPGAKDRLITLISNHGLTFSNWRNEPLMATLQADELDVTLRGVIGDTLARAIAKIAFEYYVLHVQGVAPSLMRTADTSTIRRLIADGEGGWRDTVRPSRRPVLADETETARRGQGHILALEWARDPGSPITVQVALFNDMVYEVIICERPPAIWVEIAGGHYYDVTLWEVRKLQTGRYVIPVPGIIPIGDQ